MLRRYVGLWVLGLALALCGFSAAQAVTVYIEPPGTLATHNFVFEVDLVVTGVPATPGVEVIDFVLSFDPSLINATGVTEGDFTAAQQAGEPGVPFSSIDNTAGTVSYTIARLGPTTSTGAGTLATITFVSGYTNNGVSSLTYDLTLLQIDGITEVDFTPTPGSVTVTGDAIDTPTPTETMTPTNTTSPTQTLTPTRTFTPTGTIAITPTPFPPADCELIPGDLFLGQVEEPGQVDVCLFGGLDGMEINIMVRGSFLGLFMYGSFPLRPRVEIRDPDGEVIVAYGEFLEQNGRLFRIQNFPLYKNGVYAMRIRGSVFSAGSYLVITRAQWPPFGFIEYGSLEAEETEGDNFSFGALEDSYVDVSVQPLSSSNDTFRPFVRLFDPLGFPLQTDDVIREDLDRSGTYRVQVLGGLGWTGNYLLRWTGRHPRSRRFLFE